MKENTTNPNTQLDGGTYEIIQKRLQKHKGELQHRLTQLNNSRKEVFGNVETKLIANNRINTENNCIARDIVTIGNYCLFGYNVHFGLRTEIALSDVFSIYTYEEDHFVLQPLDMINDATFLNDFSNLYKYYNNYSFMAEERFKPKGDEKTLVATCKHLCKEEGPDDKKGVFVDGEKNPVYSCGLGKDKCIMVYFATKFNEVAQVAHAAYHKPTGEIKYG